MTGKQIVLNTIKGKQTPRPPVAPFGAGIWSIQQVGSSFQEMVKNPDRLAQMNIEMVKKYKPDIVYVGSGFNNVYPGAGGGKIAYRETGAPDLVNPYIREISDLEKMDPNIISDYPPANTVWEAARMVKKEVESDTIVSMTSWAPFTIAGQMIGPEGFMRSLYKNKDLVHATVTFTTEMAKLLFEPVVDDGTLDLISIADGLASGDLISRKNFEEFVLPSLQDFISWAKEKEVPVLLHICGNTAHFLNLLPDTGASVVSLDYKVEMSKIKEEIGNKVCVAGNVNSVAVLDLGTVDTVKEATAKCLEEGAPGGRYILMPGCDLPPTVPVENLLAFYETGRSYSYN